MEGFDTDIRPLNRPLEGTPEVLDAIHMNYAPNILDSLINDLVLIIVQGPFVANPASV